MAKKKIEIINRKAAHLYFFKEKIEVGISLLGTEVKSIRAGHVNLNDAYCYFKKGELYVQSLYIKEYDHGNIFNHEARRLRKLLLKKRELRKLEKKVKEKGVTLIPHKLYMSDRGFVKLEIVVATGKRSADKRNTIKEKDMKREMDRSYKNIRI